MEGRIKAFEVQQLVGREPHGRMCRGWKGQRKSGLEKEGSVKEARKLLRTERGGPGSQGGRQAQEGSLVHSAQC